MAGEPFANLNGARIISCSIAIPFYGTWAADLILATDTAIASEDTLTVGNLALTGFVERVFDFAGSRSARMVGGFGGWQKTLPARAYNLDGGVPLAMVLGDAASEAGEKIVVPAAQNSTIGQAFVREKAPAQRVLRQLAGALWWVDPTGVTQLAARSNAAITSSFEVIHWSGGKGSFEIATEDLASWQPGRTFNSPLIGSVQTVSLVTIVMGNNGKLRLEVLATP